MNRLHRVLGGTLACVITIGSAWAQREVKDGTREGVQLSPGQARALIQEWMHTERLISQENKEWKLQQQALQQLIELYEAEVTLLSEELAVAGEATESFDQQTEALKKKEASFKRQRIAFGSQLEKQRKRLLGITEFFPKPLLQQLESDLFTLTDSNQEPRVTLLAMLNVVKSASKFNRVVSYAEEMQVLEGDQEKRQLRVLYLGLSRAYFLSGDTAGVGVPSKGGWRWKAEEGVHRSTKKAMDVYHKVARPELITLPVEVTK